MNSVGPISTLDYFKAAKLNSAALLMSTMSGNDSLWTSIMSEIDSLWRSILSEKYSLWRSIMSEIYSLWRFILGENGSETRPSVDLLASVS